MSDSLRVAVLQGIDYRSKRVGSFLFGVAFFLTDAIKELKSDGSYLASIHDLENHEVSHWRLENFDHLDHIWMFYLIDHETTLEVTLISINTLCSSC